MAVSAAYINLCHIPEGPAASREAVAFNNISATTGAFSLLGGHYGLTVVGSTFGSVTLQVLGGDATTWLTAVAAVVANGFSAVYLPAGQFRFALA